MKKIIFILFGLLAVAGCKKKGCKDEKAVNYNHDPNVTSDPGSCEFLELFNIKTKNILPGAVTEPTVWGQVEGAQVDYYINSSIAIESTLTITPGVIIEFGPLGNLYLKGGKLLALGENNNRIILRNATSENWLGITVSSYDYDNRELHLSNIDIINVTGSIYNPGSINLDDHCHSQLNNVTITGNTNVGLYIHGLDDSFPQNFLTNMTITNCSRPLVSEELSILNYDDEFNLINNTNNWIEFPLSSYSAYTGLFSSIYPNYFSYSNNKTVSKLNAGPGTEFLINGGYLDVLSDFLANGTSSSPVVFKGVNGNTWKGLKMRLSESPSLNYVNIEGVTSTSNTQAPIYLNFNAGGTITFTNCNIQATDVPCGIKFQYNNVLNSQVDITGSTFTGCDTDVCY